MVKDDKVKDAKPDFSFDQIQKDIDDKISKQDIKKSEVGKTEIKIPHFSDKIKQGLEIKNNLPDPGFLNVAFEEVRVVKKDSAGNDVSEKKILVRHKDAKGIEYAEITSGLFEMDLRNDAYFWFVRTPEVIPQRIKQCVRAAIDRKKCYEYEKRKLELPYLMLIILGVGAAIIAIAFFMMMMK